jgi:hypothetical protein
MKRFFIQDFNKHTGYILRKRYKEFKYYASCVVDYIGTVFPELAE